MSGVAKVEMAARLAAIRERGLPDAGACSALARELAGIVGDLGGIRAKVKLVVLRTTTLEPIADPLVVDAAANGVLLSVAFGTFAPLEAQVAGMDFGATAGGEHREIVMLVPEWGDLAGGLDGAGADEGAKRLAALLGGIRGKTHAPVFVQLPSDPVVAPFAAEDWRDANGHRASVERALVEWGGVVAGVADCFALAPVGGALDARLWQSHRMAHAPSVLRDMALAWSRAIGARVLPRAKVLVLDADNTLWGGVVGEVGVSGVTLAKQGLGSGYRALQGEAMLLRSRGVLLAVCSKNDEAIVLDALANHPDSLIRPEHLAAKAVSWDSKVAGLNKIASELNLGLDSLVFVDDNPHECEAVRQGLPMVTVYQVPSKPHLLPGFLASIREFDVLRVLKEDRAKAEQYRARAGREAVTAMPTGASSIDFLASLDLVGTVAGTEDTTLDRVAQMESKTNQFNTTTLRLTRTELDQVLETGGHVVGIGLRDKFGDHGLTVSGVVEVVGGVASARDEIGGSAGDSPEASSGRIAVISSMLASCRVIGLGGEQAAIAAIVEWARERGISHIYAPIRETERNQPCRAVFELNGFAVVAEPLPPALDPLAARLSALGGAVTWWHLEVGKSTVEWPQWVARGSFG